MLSSGAENRDLGAVRMRSRRAGWSDPGALCAGRANRRWERRARAQRRGPPRPPCARPADGRGPPLGRLGGLGVGLWAARARRAQLVDRTGGRPGTGCLGQCAGPEWRAGVLRRRQGRSAGRARAAVQGAGVRAWGRPHPLGRRVPAAELAGRPLVRVRGRAAVCRGGSERARADSRGRGARLPLPLRLRPCPARAPLVPRSCPARCFK